MKQRKVSGAQTAYHEAGHTVVRLYEGREVKRITIVPQGGAGGSMTAKRGADECPEFVMDEEADSLALEHMAGPIAANIFCGRRESFNQWIARASYDEGFDLDHVSRLIGEETPTQIDFDRVRGNRLWRRTHAILRRWDVWRTVRKLVTLLRQRGTVSGKDASKTMGRFMTRRRGHELLSEPDEMARDIAQERRLTPK